MDGVVPHRKSTSCSWQHKAGGQAKVGGAGGGLCSTQSFRDSGSFSGVGSLLRFLTKSSILSAGAQGNRKENPMWI